MHAVKEAADSATVDQAASQHAKRIEKEHHAINHACKDAIVMPVMSGTETDAYYHGTVPGNSRYYENRLYLMHISHT